MEIWKRKLLASIPLLVGIILLITGVSLEDQKDKKTQKKTNTPSALIAAGAFLTVMGFNLMYMIFVRFAIQQPQGNFVLNNNNYHYQSVPGA